ncbi:universal stress protein [Gymnodinialimonas sp. 57CJ19]|uniref:universal stress protein n=1 Tax=Gymnodinialimonas sp. 57CJ19 TaxID=3138498 RepID=UPI0031346149
MTKTTVIAAVDRFPEDDAVLLRGIEVAGRHQTTLRIVHVADVPDYAASAAVMGPRIARAKTSAQQRIDAALGRLGIAPDAVDVRLEVGDPADRLVALSQQMAPAVMVMRARHQPWIAQKLFGSVTERVIAAGVASVLVVKPEVTRPYGRVLAAVEGADTADAALSDAMAAVPGVDIEVVHAVAVEPRLEQAMLRVGSPLTEITAHLEALVQDAERRLALRAQAWSPGVTWRVLRGDPAQQLVHATRADGVDLIALGPHRSGMLTRIFSGSVIQQLIRDAACDVLIGPAPAPAPVQDNASRAEIVA